MNSHSVKKIKKNIVKFLKNVNYWHYLILCLIAFGVIYLVKFFGYSGEERVIRVQIVGKDWSELYYQNEGYRPPFWLIESIEVGDVERGPEGSVNAEIIEVESYERERGSFDTYLTVRLRGVTNINLNKFTYRGIVIEVGSPIKLSLDKAVVYGQIIDDDIFIGEKKKQKFLIKVIKKQAENWIVNSIEKGDVVTDGEKVIATVVSKSVNYSNNYFYSNVSRFSNGFELIRDDSFKELELELELEANLHNGRWYFASITPLKVGGMIDFYFEDTNLSSASITSVLELEDIE